MSSIVLSTEEQDKGPVVKKNKTRVGEIYL